LSIISHVYLSLIIKTDNNILNKKPSFVFF